MTSWRRLSGAALLMAAFLWGGCSETPERGEEDGSAMAFDMGNTPAPDQGTTPTPDQGATPTPDQGTAPTPDQGTTPTPDQGTTPTPDQGAMTGELGAPCNVNSDCDYNICSTNTHTGAKFCTKVCDPCAAEPCPSGFGCQDAGLAFICAPGYPNAPCT